MNNLKQLKEDIERLNPIDHIAIGKIFYDSKVNMFENKNGVFINLTDIDECILQKIREKLNYIQEQEEYFESLELKKQAYKDNLNSKVNEVNE